MEENMKYPPAMQMHYSLRDERQYLAENSSYPTPMRNPQGSTSSPTNQFLNFVKGKFKIAYDSIKNAFTWNSDATAMALEDLSRKTKFGPLFGQNKDDDELYKISGDQFSIKKAKPENYDIGDARNSSFLRVIKYHKEILTKDIKAKIANEKLTIIPKLTLCQNYPKLVRPRNKIISFEKLSHGYRVNHFDNYGNLIMKRGGDLEHKDSLEDLEPQLIRSDSKNRPKKQVSFSNQKLTLEKRHSGYFAYTPFDEENLKKQAQKKIKLANGKFIYANPETIVVRLNNKLRPKEVQFYKKPVKSSLNKNSYLKSHDNYVKQREYAKHEKLDKQFIHESSFASDVNVNDSKVETDEEDNTYRIQSYKKSKRKSYEFDDEYQDDYTQEEVPPNIQQSPIHKREYPDEDEENEEDNQGHDYGDQDEFEEYHETDTNSYIEPKKEPAKKIESTPIITKAEQPKQSFSLFTQKPEKKQESPKIDSPLQGSPKQEITTKQESPKEEPKKEVASKPLFEVPKSNSGLFANLNKDEGNKPEVKPLLFNFSNKKPEDAKNISDSEKKDTVEGKESLPSTQSSEPEKKEFKLFSNITSIPSTEKKAAEGPVEEKKESSEKIEVKEIKKTDSPTNNLIASADEKKEAEKPQETPQTNQQNEPKAEEKSATPSWLSNNYSLNKPLANLSSSSAPINNPFVTKAQPLQSSQPVAENTNNPFLKAKSLSNPPSTEGNAANKSSLFQNIQTPIVNTNNNTSPNTSSNNPSPFLTSLPNQSSGGLKLFSNLINKDENGQATSETINPFSSIKPNPTNPILGSGATGLTKPANLFGTNPNPNPNSNSSLFSNLGSNSNNSNISNMNNEPPKPGSLFGHLNNFNNNNNNNQNNNMTSSNIFSNTQTATVPFLNQNNDSQGSSNPFNRSNTGGMFNNMNSNQSSSPFLSNSSNSNTGNALLASFSTTSGGFGGSNNTKKKGPEKQRAYG